ncbi:MAG: heavy-metal-associated domain-containing protein [Thermodesulfobacteriota bacterium]
MPRKPFHLAVMTLAALLAAAGLAVAEPIRTTLQVDNLTCGACLSRISNALSTVDGISAMDASLQQGLVMVDHDSSLAAEQVARVVTEAGYPARVLGQSPPPSPAAAGPEGGTPPAAAAGRSGCGGCDSPACGATAAAWQQLWQRLSGGR